MNQKCHKNKANRPMPIASTHEVLWRSDNERVLKKRIQKTEEGKKTRKRQNYTHRKQTQTRKKE